ncbi:MAG: alpha-L-fucosidase [Acidobacteria bacterium]|nr:alpha-L-fucosidase [Acidobacteriota bacterium]
MSLFLFAFFLFAAGPQDRQRYFDYRFGMFIHWGPYSQASVEASWPIMRPNPKGINFITEPDYRRLAETFNPVRFDPKAWIRLAKAAGQRYMVLTSKHHDGFVMFDSSYTRNKIANTPYKKDIVAQLAQACREEGMPLGFYYSPPDMDHPGFRDTSKPSSANWQGEPWRAEWFLYLDYMEAQLRELLTRYGDILVVWFDGLGNQEKYDGLRFHKLVRELQPGAAINNRIGLPGDFDTPEQFTPKGVPSRPWETCMTINRTWAYNRHDTNYKSTTQLIRTLVDVASKGGNFLLNVGPTPEGTIQPEFEERLRAIGEWMKVNGEAIYGTTYGPLQGLSFGRTTAKGKTVYLHVFDWPAGKLEVDGLAARIASVRLLKGNQPLQFTQRGAKLSVDVPSQPPDPHATVLALQ